MDRQHAQHFRDVQGILRTGSRARFGRGASKLMHFILQGVAADLQITERSFIVRFDWNTARHSYFMDLAPGVVSALLEWCEVSTVLEPRAARFAADRIPRFGYLARAFKRADRNVWFLPGPTVQLFVRCVEPNSNVPL